PVIVSVRRPPGRYIELPPEKTIKQNGYYIYGFQPARGVYKREDPCTAGGVRGQGHLGRDKRHRHVIGLDRPGPGTQAGLVSRRHSRRIQPGGEDGLPPLAVYRV